MFGKSPSNLEEHLGYWLRCLSNYVHHSFAQKLEKHEITVPQWVVLRALYDKEAVNLNNIADEIGVDKSTLSRMVERLVQKGLVDRGAGKDRRSVNLALTKAGRKIVPQLAKLADDNDDQFFKTLSKSEKQNLEGIVKRLLRANGWEAENKSEAA